MRIVKPWGRSYVEPSPDGLRRVVRLNADLDTPVGVAEFAATHPELIIAQWVSVIDKIATKPRLGRKPTKAQRALRDVLGEAAWEILAPDLRSREGEEETKRLERLWRRKIHPYGWGTREEWRPPDPRGRRFVAFTRETDPALIDARRVAERIRDHLLVEQRHWSAASGPGRIGLIAARAESIARNAPHGAAPPDEDAGTWSDADKERYMSAGDIAGDIVREAQKRRGRLFPRHVAPILYRRFGELFRDEDGGASPAIAQAREREPGLFALHMAVRDAYARSIEGGRKRDLPRTLPQDMAALMRLVEARRRNREVAATVRLGKVLHYAAARSADAPSNVIDDWPATVADSRYRTSEGQSEIKRNEAFVRIWRGVLALAARTAADWANPRGRIAGDILGRRAREDAAGEGFDADAWRKKLPLLFGDRDSLFANGDAAFEKSVLSLALEGLKTLRDSSFHFKGRGGFVSALRAVGGCGDDGARAAARELWRRDEDGRAERLREEMRAAHFDRCLAFEQCRSVFEAARAPSPDRPPLPRFRRVLTRVEHAWRATAWALRLPAPGNRSDLEDPATLCRYTALKLLFERAFPAWLAERPAADANRWLERAVERATEAARMINRDGFALSRAAGLPRLREGERIGVFLDRLAAATATEFRVQRGYDPNPERARKQARYLDDIRCDTVAQAFERYLEAEGFPWLLEEVDAPSDGPPCDLDALAPPGAETPPAEDWQAVLYFLAHLAPVEEIVKLRHQLRKLALLEPGASPEAEAAGRVFDLYIDMHDAKFDGGKGVAGARALEGLFETPETFARVCPEAPEDDADGHVPWRGLREILRFGGLSPLMPVFRRHPVRAGDVDAVEAAEADGEGGSPIAGAQKRREDLHRRWTEYKRSFTDGDREAYREALAEVSRHRLLAAHVRLRNHARLHRLAMQVLGRLVDYAGLWERDLYFATLALIVRENSTPRDVFDEKGLTRLRDGRIVDALRHLEEQPEETGLIRALKRLFGEDFLDGRKGAARARNNLAHFNMLRRDREALNLTDAVNDARRLMAYDRKLKNAVSKSVIELIGREGMDLKWRMSGHRLCDATVATRRATHLGDRRIQEDLHGGQFVAMVASLFGGEPVERRPRPAPGRRKGGRKP